MTKQSSRLSTMLGVGAFCATLVVAPLINVVLPNETSAAGGPPSAGVCSSTVNDGKGTILWQNAEALRLAINDNFPYANSDMDSIINFIDAIENKSGAYTQVHIDIENVKQYMDGDMSDLDQKSMLEVIKAATQTSNYNENLDFKRAVYVLSDHLIYYMKELKSTMSKLAPDVELTPEQFYTVVDQIWTTENSFFEIFEFNETAIRDILSAAKSIDNYQELYDLRSLHRQVQNTCYMSSYWEDEDEGNDIYGRYVTKDEVYSLIANTITAAKRINPNFTVELIEDRDTTTPDIAENNKPNTATQPTTIESNNKNVKVSGLNIKTDYSLTVKAVSSDLLKLTGNDFKNSINQAFYDIYIHDDQNNRIENTGKVSVSIKLPSNMSSKSDFVVYYVPTTANGEYLADQAKAITGVKVSADGWLTFETDHFSVYGIVEYPKGKAPNTGVVAQNESSATATGVKVVAGIISVLIAVGAAIVTHRQIIRNEQKNNQ